MIGGSEGAGRQLQLVPKCDGWEAGATAADLTGAPVSGWSQGRVTLLGDAAHPTTPNLGQGAGMAIEDAVVLAHWLSSAGDISAAFREFERSRRARTTRIVNASWQIGRLGKLEGALSTSIRDLSFRATPQWFSKRQMRENARFD